MEITGGNHLKIVTEKYLYLEDGPGPDHIAVIIDEVVDELKKLMELDQRRIICLDAYGSYDEIILKDGYFSHYRQLPTDDPLVIEIRAFVILN